MPLPHKPAVTTAKPFGPYPDLFELDEREKAIPEIVSYHRKLNEWYYDLRRVLLREREELQS